MQISTIMRIRVAHAVRSLLKFLPSSNEVGRIYTTNNGTFAIGATDTMFMSRFHRGRAHGEEEIGQIRKLVPAESHVLIVGTHVGTLAIPISTFIRQVTAVEANPATFALLQANVLLNRRDNLSLIEVAAGESDGAIEFLVSKSNTGGSKRKPQVRDIRYYFDDPDVITVPMRRLDDVVSSRVDAVVMDIEGSEYFALKGMPRILSEANLLAIEFLSHHLRNVAGVDPDAWYAAIGSAFRYLHIPSTGESVADGEILPLLRAMFAADRNEDAIIFSKSPLHALAG